MNKQMTPDAQRVCTMTWAALKESNWTPMYPAVNSDGNPVEPTNPTAIRWSLLGILSRNCEILLEGIELELVHREVILFLCKALGEDAKDEIEGTFLICRWHVDPKRAFADVQKLLEDVVQPDEDEPIEMPF